MTSKAVRNLNSVRCFMRCLVPPVNTQCHSMKSPLFLVSKAKVTRFRYTVKAYVKKAYVKDCLY